MKFKRDFLWIVLFGTLIGLNETLLGGMHIPNKSILLSVITLLFLSIARYLFPIIGSSLMIIAVASLFKITDLGLMGCKLESIVMLCTGFEIFASLFIRKKNLQSYRFPIVSFISAIVAFSMFGLMQRYVVGNEFWFGPKFTEYLFIKGPITGVVSAGISFLGVMAIKPMIAWYNKVIVQRVAIINSIVGVAIVAIWVLGYFTA
ncbi:MAG: hypothetical protein WCQ95_10705 [Bacteroidota bacterium]